MTVRDLIDILKDYPEDMNIMVSVYGMFDFEYAHYAMIKNHPCESKNEQVVMIS